MESRIHREVYVRFGRGFRRNRLRKASTARRCLPYQNEDAFKFTDDLLGEGVTYETAGALQGGRKAWMLARMPHRYIICGAPVRTAHMQFVGDRNTAVSKRRVKA
ncbi:MAG: DUF945 domain-containing protein [Lachnospiraceae bacterium]|nr:DUF945 domain-containing protein [Lachnospiraceae bacterium]